MNDETSLTVLYKKHVPLEQVPESSKKKASKSEKNPEKKPELDKVHEWLRENFETQPQAMENDAETEQKHEEEQDTQSEVSLEE